MMTINAIMVERHTRLFICVLLINLVAPINCQVGADWFEEITTTSTTPGYQEPTDIPQEDIDDALNMDIGRYSTVSFHYEQHQWMHSQWSEVCYEQYTKCISGLSAPMPVCMFHTQMFKSGYKYVNSYCDAYFENCRIGYRYWRLIQYGRCDLGWGLIGWDEMIEV